MFLFFKTDSKAINLSILLHLSLILLIILADYISINGNNFFRTKDMKFIEIALELEDFIITTPIDIENKIQQPLTPEEESDGEPLNKVSQSHVEDTPTSSKTKDSLEYEQLLSLHFNHIIKNKIRFPDKKPVTIMIEINKFGKIVQYEFISKISNLELKNALFEKIKLADPVPVPPLTNNNKFYKYFIDLLPPQ